MPVEKMTKYIIKSPHSGILHNYYVEWGRSTCTYTGVYLWYKWNKKRRFQAICITCLPFQFLKCHKYHMCWGAFSFYVTPVFYCYNKHIPLLWFYKSAVNKHNSPWEPSANPRSCIWYITGDTGVSENILLLDSLPSQCRLLSKVSLCPLRRDRIHAHQVCHSPSRELYYLPSLHLGFPTQSTMKEQWTPGWGSRFCLGRLHLWNCRSLIMLPLLLSL